MSRTGGVLCSLVSTKQTVSAGGVENSENSSSRSSFLLRKFYPLPTLVIYIMRNFSAFSISFSLLDAEINEKISCTVGILAQKLCDKLDFSEEFEECPKVVEAENTL